MRVPLTLVAALCSVLAGCGRPPQGPQGPVGGPPAVTVGKPLVERIVEWDPYTGRLAAIEEVDVQARVSGYLESHHFEEGQLVERGQLLFVIDPRPFEAALAQADAAEREAVAGFRRAEAQVQESQAAREQVAAKLDLAQTRLRRNRPLAPSGAISADELDVLESEARQVEADLLAADAKIESSRASAAASEATIATAQAAVRTARLDLSYTRVESPITGRIGRRIVTEGNLVSGGLGATLLTTIVSLDPIHAYFDADEQSLLKYTRLALEGKRESSRDAKNPVYMALADEEGFPHRGHMDFVDNQVDRATGSIRGRAIFANPGAVFTPGGFVRVRIPGSASYEAVLVPDAAVATDQDAQFVYVVDEKNQLASRPVVTGPMVKGLRVVRSGLDGSERIVTTGLQRCRAGIEVAPTEAPIVVGSPDGLPDAYEPIVGDEVIRGPSSQSDEVPAAEGTP